jgi:hypothetical protein
MKKFYFTALLLLLGVITLPVHAQDGADSDNPELGLWNGGYMAADFYIGPDFLNGGMSSQTGGVFSGRAYSGAEFLNSMPSMLGTLNKVSVTINTRAGVGTWLTDSFVDARGELNSTIETETNSLFNDEESWIRPPGSQVISTNVTSFTAGIPAGIRNMSISYPVYNNVGLAVSYSHNVLSDVNFKVNGITAKIAQEQGTEDVSVRFDVLMNIAMNTVSNLSLRTFSVGAGGTVFESGSHEVMVGASMQRYRAQNERLINTELSGMVVVGYADERFFNNPTDPNINFDNGETNRLFLNARGNFTDLSYGYNLNAYYRLNKKWGFSLSYVKNPSLELTDANATSEAYLPIFVKGEDLFKDEIIVELDQLEANKPNITTERDVSDLIRPLSIDLPSYLGLGIDVPMGNHTFALNYKYYTSDFRFAYGDDEFGKENAMGAGFAFDFNHTNKFKNWGWTIIPVRLLLLDFDGLLLQSMKKYTRYRNPHITFGTSVMLGDGYASGGFDESMADNMSLPTPLGFNLGRRYTILNGIEIGFNLINYPDLLFTYSLGIQL